ncbi:MAG: hypothetical protein WC421_03165 [Elusimicrobiales bacterium]
MDILTKLRIAFWFLVLLLWGTFMADFFRIDAKSARQAVKKVLVRAHLYVPPRDISDQPEGPPKPYDAEPPGAAPQDGRKSGSALLKILNDSVVVGVAEPEEKPEDKITGIPQERGNQEKPPPVDFSQPPSAQPEPPSFPPPPATFVFSHTRHFVIYRDKSPISDDLMRGLEDLHRNIMMDLIAFSPWTREARVLIYLFTSPRIYRIVSGRPAWSGGASSSSRRLMYVLEEADYMGIIAHELTHIYFDSFFNKAWQSPLWLSEGMAVFMQADRANAPPSWLSDDLDELAQGKGLELARLISVNSLDGMEEDEVKLWYTQCYSVVRFMLRLKPAGGFYTFCRMLRDGEPLNQCLVRAYGMPFDRLSSLESAWRQDLKNRNIAGM